ncbi:hypothetical protein F4677DRAFT_431925 [Hypoxylon crocopeplum]|nr:hypothetical protein F4677DRAFT_431925 [Hypoxylon crocopeplum]
MPIIVPKPKPKLKPKSRHVGLSKNQKPPGLLRQINNRDTQASLSRPANIREMSQMSRGRKVREPESIDAPPQSSDDEDYLRLRPTPENGLQDSDDDDGDKKRGVDIKPTVFSIAQLPSSQISNTRRSTRERSKPSSQNEKVGGGYQRDEPSSSAGSKRSAEDPVSEMGSHLTDSYGFFNKKSKTTNTRRATTYGSKSSQPKSSQSRSSQKSAPRSSAPQLNTRSPPGKSFKHYDAGLSPENVRSPPARGFIKPRNVSPERTKPSKAFIKPMSSPGSSPSRDTRRPVFRHRGSPLDDSPEKSKIKLYDPDDGSDAAAETKPSIGQRSSRAKRPRRPKARKRQGSPDPVKDEFSQRPAFKLHALDDLDYLDDSDDELAAVFEDKVSDDEVSDATSDSPIADAARCPMCHDVVDAGLLAKYSDRGRMNIKKQAAFCRLHKRQTALDSRSQKGYPKIDWETLDTRFAKHQGFLRGILEGTRQSHYSDILKENVESGKNRTLLKTEDSLTPGYYGPRGLRAMTEYIMRTFSSVVRKRAVEDRLVSARGYTGYVQTVLVPELAVRLIMEDMDVTEEDARNIMQDSIEVGELLYEEAGDVIAGASDEEGM